MNPRYERLKKKVTGRNRRNRRQLGATVKEWGGYAAAHHLGTKNKHDADVLAQRHWVLTQKARELGVSVKDLDDKIPVEEDLAKAGMPGSREDQARMGGQVDGQKDLKGLLGDSGLVLSLAKVGDAGKREWKDLEGGLWVSRMMQYKSERCHYVTANRHHQKNMKGALEVMLARLPPWVALEISKDLLADPTALREKVVELARNFGDRYNADVLGAVVHRESEYDLHVHLIFSRTREVAIPKKAPARLIAARRKIECERIRTMLKRARKPCSNKIVSELLGELIAKGEIPPLDLEKVVVENRRYEPEPDEPADGEEPPVIHRRVLGHAFRSKLEIWRASAPEDSDAIAALKDGNPREPWSFRGGVIEPELRGESLEDIWWDLWTAAEWQRVCLDGSSQETLNRVTARGVSMAQDYLRYGSTVANQVERLSAEKMELRRRLERLEAHGSTALVEATQNENLQLRDTLKNQRVRTDQVETENKDLQAQLTESLEAQETLKATVSHLQKEKSEISKKLKDAIQTSGPLKGGTSLPNEEIDSLELNKIGAGYEEMTLEAENQTLSNLYQIHEESSERAETIVPDLIERINVVLDRVAPRPKDIEISMLKRLEQVVRKYIETRDLLSGIQKAVSSLGGKLPENMPKPALNDFQKLRSLVSEKDTDIELR